MLSLALTCPKAPKANSHFVVCEASAGRHPHFSISFLPHTSITRPLHTRTETPGTSAGRNVIHVRSDNVLVLTKTLDDRRLCPNRNTLRQSWMQLWWDGSVQWHNLSSVTAARSRCCSRCCWSEGAEQTFFPRRAASIQNAV